MKETRTQNQGMQDQETVTEPGKKTDELTKIKEKHKDIWYLQMFPRVVFMMF